MASAAAAAANNDDDDDDEMDLGAIGFMFDAQHARCTKRLDFTLPSSSTPTTDTTTIATVGVTVRLIGEDPGHVQSGQYLWPAAAYTARYLIEHWGSLRATAVVELGAGVGVAGLVVAQLPGCRRVVLTDYDPGALQLLRENIALNSGADGATAAAAATGVVGECECSVTFLEWGNLAAGNVLLTADGIGSSGSSGGNLQPPPPQSSTADASLFPLVLGTDLLYSVDIVEPLFTTAMQLMRRAAGDGAGAGAGDDDGEAGRFLLVSSFYPGQVQGWHATAFPSFLITFSFCPGY